MFRPTITDMQDKYCGDRYDIYRIQSRYTKVAAFGRHHKRGGAAFGRATSFVVSFVVVVNRVNIVAVNTILVLHLGKTGRSVGRTDFGLDGWSAGLGCPMDGRQDGRTNEWSGGLGNARRCSAVLDGSKIMKITSSLENGPGPAGS